MFQFIVFYVFALEHKLKIVVQNKIKHAFKPIVNKKNRAYRRSNLSSNASLYLRCVHSGGFIDHKHKAF